MRGSAQTHFDPSCPAVPLNLDEIRAFTVITTINNDNINPI